MRLQIEIERRFAALQFPAAISSFAFFLVFSLLLSVIPTSFAQAQNPDHSQATPTHSPEADTSGAAPTKDDAAQIANAAIAGLEKSGDVSKLDRDLFHPVFFEAPCALIAELTADVCRQLQAEERREFAWSQMNILWITFEHLMSMEDPVSLFENSQGDQKDLVSVLFPEEVHDLMAKVESQPQTVEEFRRQSPVFAEIETRLLQERQTHDHVNQPAYRKNVTAVDDTLRISVDQLLQFSPVSPEEWHGAMPENTYRYTKFPFFFYITKSDGKPKIVWLEMVHD